MGRGLAKPTLTTEKKAQITGAASFKTEIRTHWRSIKAIWWTTPALKKKRNIRINS